MGGGRGGGFGGGKGNYGHTYGGGNDRMGGFSRNLSFNYLRFNLIIKLWAR